VEYGVGNASAPDDERRAASECCAETDAQRAVAQMIDAEPRRCANAEAGCCHAGTSSSPSLRLKKVLLMRRADDAPEPLMLLRSKLRRHRSRWSLVPTMKFEVA
jgi:hypothetical protein